MLMFGRPFFVLSLNQISFEKGSISDSRIRLVTTVFDPLSIFVAKMKQTGITIYGQDLISQLKFSTSAIDKIRVAAAPLWLVTMSLLSFPLDELLSLKHSMKATLWACEDVLFALNIPLSTSTKEALLISNIFAKHARVDLTHLMKTIALRRADFLKERTSKGSVARHILGTIWFILTLYYYASLIVRTSNEHRYSMHQQNNS